MSKEYFSKDYFFGEKKSNYNNYYHIDKDLYWRRVITKIKKYGMNGRILDLGCAFGFLLKRAKPFFVEAYGLDISEFAIDEAKKHAPFAKLKIVDIDAQSLPYPDKFFDLITALDVLEHTQSIEMSIEKIMPKLKDKGYLLIALPLKDTWAGKIFRLIDKDDSHINVPAKKEFLAIIERSGLNIIEKDYFLPYFGIKGIPFSVEVLLQAK